MTEIYYFIIQFIVKLIKNFFALSLFPLSHRNNDCKLQNLNLKFKIPEKFDIKTPFIVVRPSDWYKWHRYIIYSYMPHNPYQYRDLLFLVKKNIYIIFLFYIKTNELHPILLFN